MKQIITESQFINAFKSWDTYKNQFSYEGLKALYNYLEELGDDIGEQIELDVIALCCEYSEYDSFKEFQEAYGVDYGSLEKVQEYTTVIKIDDNKFIIQQF